MVVWAGYLDGVASNRQFEVFGRRLSFVPPAVQAATRSDGATITPLNNGDLINASVRELGLTFAELLRNGDDVANYRLVSGSVTSCSGAGSSLIASVDVNLFTVTIQPTIQPLPDVQYTLIACATLTSAGGITLGSDVAITFTIDTTAPSLSLPDNISAEATDASGSVVTYTATASDAVAGAVPVTCTPASGSTFPLGVTTVTCSASDPAGNTATGSFTVTVVDTTPPSLRLPDNLSREATGPDGAAVVTYTATASDAVAGAVPVTCTPASGSTFPLGVTTVTCSASDPAGNTATGSFTVTITPSGAPQIPPHRLFIPIITRV